MGFAEFVFGISFVSIIVGGLIKIADLCFGRRGNTSAGELTAGQDRIRTLETQLLESYRQNEVLQKQLEWHTRLLATQDSAMPQSIRARA
jgi:hypothetical protein